MARSRSLKPDFWTSPQIIALSEGAALCFCGLWNYCDCHGIHPADPIRLKLEIAAGRPEVTPEVMAERVQEMIDQRLVREYKVDGERYWMVTGWAKHQYPWKPNYRHPVPPDYADSARHRPPPPANGGQRPPTVATVSTRDKISNKDSVTRTRKRALPDGAALTRFADAAAVYPPGKKKNLSTARQYWARDHCDGIADTIIADIEARQARDADWLRGAIPHFPTYINQRRWNDPIEEPTDEERQGNRRRAESAPEQVDRANPSAFEPDLPGNVIPLDSPDWPEEA